MSKILEPGSKKKEWVNAPRGVLREVVPPPELSMRCTPIFRIKKGNIKGSRVERVGKWEIFGKNENIIFFTVCPYWPIIYSKLSNKSSLLSVKKLVESKLLQCVQEVVTHFKYLVNYYFLDTQYIKWVTTSWTYGINRNGSRLCWHISSTFFWFHKIYIFVFKRRISQNLKPYSWWGVFTLIFDKWEEGYFYPPSFY